MASLDAYARMNADDRKGVLKPDLKKIVDEQLALINNDPNTIRNLIVNTINIAIDRKFNEFEKRFKELNEHCEGEIKRLEDKVKEQSRLISAQQRFLEDIDSERRAKNLIVLGLKEDEDDDKDKFLEVARTIGISQDDLVIEKLTRLGKLNENQTERIRPLKMTFDSPEMKNKVLKNAYKLKNQNDDDPYKKVFLKKDLHPEVRNEEKRLYDVFKKEKAKPENADKSVIFDRKSRIITCNGEEIDKFKLFTHFQ